MTEQATRATDDVQVKPGELRNMRPRELAIRFGFGAGVSLLAAIVSTVAGARVGGVFLAFPAILLASLTLIAKKDGVARARDDARGAALGTLGLIAFALVAAVTLTRWHPAAALATATAAWAVVSLAAYLVVRSAGSDGDEP